jgi:hypothetical protein
LHKGWRSVRERGKKIDRRKLEERQEERCMAKK